MKTSLTEEMSTDTTVVLSECDELTARFEREVMPLRAELLRAAMRLTNRRPDAEDLVQDALLRAWRSFGTFQPGTNVRAWMHTVLKNSWINNYRATQRRPAEVMTDDVTEPAADQRPADNSPADLTLIAAQPDQEVHAAMVELSDEFRMVVYLADVEGYSYAAIADMMGTPLGTVMSRLHRARRQLRGALGGTARRRRLIVAA